MHVSTFFKTNLMSELDLLGAPGGAAELVRCRIISKGNHNRFQYTIGTNSRTGVTAGVLILRGIARRRLQDSETIGGARIRRFSLRTKRLQSSISMIASEAGEHK